MNNRNSPNDEQNVNSEQNRSPLISYIRQVFSRSYENSQMTRDNEEISQTSRDLLRMVWTRMQLNSGNDHTQNSLENVFEQGEERDRDSQELEEEEENQNYQSIKNPNLFKFLKKLNFIIL
jgi:hypothetical protein